MDVTVEEPRQDRLAAKVDLLIAVQAAPDLDDPPILHGEIRDGGIGTASVEDQASGKQRPRHGASVPRSDGSGSIGPSPHRRS